MNHQPHQHPPHRHLIAAVGYLAVAFLFFANDGNYGKVKDLISAAYVHHVPPSLVAVLPSTAAGWVTVVVVIATFVYQLTRAVRAADAEDARVSARLDVVERNVASAAAAAARATAAGDGRGGGASAASACNDPSCFRCRPDVHSEALSRHSARLLERLRGGGGSGRASANINEGGGGEVLPALEGVSDEILALAAANVSSGGVASAAAAAAARNSSKTHASSSAPSVVLGQAPTVFRLPSLPAAPVHCRGGVGCGWPDGPKEAGAATGAGAGAEAEGVGSRRCWCAGLWREGTGDIWKLERACASVTAELDAACARERREGEEEGEVAGHFAAFDPAVHRGGEWSAVYLWRNGVRDDANCRAFPAAAAAVDGLAQAAYRGSGRVGESGGGGGGGCAFGSAYLSRLSPGTKLTPHCGPCNARLRCHLALRVPPPAAGAAGEEGGGSSSSIERREPCELWVAGQRKTWTEGEALLFDDSFEHSAAYHHSIDDAAAAHDAPSRVVLVVDFWHPELSASDRAALSVLYPPGM